MRASDNTTCAQCGGTFEQVRCGSRKYCKPCSAARHKEAIARNNASYDNRIALKDKQKYGEGYAAWMTGTTPPQGKCAAEGVRAAAMKHHHEKVVVAVDEPDVMIIYDPMLAKDAVVVKPTFEEVLV